MKSWALFIISIGSIFVCMSQLMANPIYLLGSGILCMIIGGVMLKKERGYHDR